MIIATACSQSGKPKLQKPVLQAIIPCSGKYEILHPLTCSTIHMIWQDGLSDSLVNAIANVMKSSEIDITIFLEMLKIVDDESILRLEDSYTAEEQWKSESLF
jgi:hypothetical protein